MRRDSPEDLIVHAVRVTVGAGKSHAARDRLVRQIVGMRARGNGRSIVVAVPRHDLGDDYLDALRPPLAPHGLVVDTWRGRDAADPAHPGYARRRALEGDLVLMCRDLARVKDAQAVSLSVQEAVCQREVTASDGTVTTEACPHSGICGYQAQRRRRADVWIVAHEGVFHQKPNAMGEVAALIIDEAAWAKGLTGIGKPITLAVDALMADATLTGDDGRLRDLRRQLQDLLRDSPLGPVRRDAVRETMLTAESTAEARRLEWRRKVRTMHPGQTAAERRVAMDEAAGNPVITRLVMAWTAIEALLSPGAPEASGWIELAEEATPAGPVRVIRLKGRRPVAAGWCVPTLILDAIAEISMLKPYWQRATLVADVAVSTPHQRTWQTVDRAYAKSRLEPLEDPAADPAEARRRARRLADVRAYVVRQALRCGTDQVLVVLQKRVREALAAMGPLPANVALAHHNGVAGMDQWRYARPVIVVGRTQPRTADVEHMAEALTGAACTRVTAYDRADARRETADGRSVPCEADRHPDPVAEAIRWQVAEGEIIQVIGRGRGVNRTLATPPDVLVMTDLALPIPIDGSLTDADLKPTLADRMLADTGLAPDVPAHAARCHPARWRNAAAARQALHREAVSGQEGEDAASRCVTPSIIEKSTGECHSPHAPRRIAYQVAGPGNTICYATYAPALCPDPVSVLSARLGPLVWHRIEDPPDEPSTSTPDVTRQVAPVVDIRAGEASAGQRQAAWPPCRGYA